MHCWQVPPFKLLQQYQIKRDLKKKLYILNKNIHILGILAMIKALFDTEKQTQQTFFSLFFTHKPFFPDKLWY